ncbi:MAG: hypothetical protein HQM11_16840 [SAR324 cluster bacterium]|nr:hypothetical protein [SAR324 cluster bacterium]
MALEDLGLLGFIESFLHEKDIKKHVDEFIHSIISHDGIMEMISHTTQTFFTENRVRRTAARWIRNIPLDKLPETIKTIVWNEPEISLGVVGAIPNWINAGVRTVDQLLTELKSRVSPELISSYVEFLVQDLDVESITRVRNHLDDLYKILKPVIEERLAQAQRRQSCE